MLFNGHTTWEPCTRWKRLAADDDLSLGHGAPSLTSRYLKLWNNADSRAKVASVMLQSPDAVLFMSFTGIVVLLVFQRPISVYSCAMERLNFVSCTVHHYSAPMTNDLDFEVP